MKAQINNDKDINFDLVFSSEQFTKELEKVIDALTKLITASKHIEGIKSNPALLAIQKLNLLNASSIKTEFVKICNRQSFLPSAQRQIIDNIVLKAINNTIKLNQDAKD